MTALTRSDYILFGLAWGTPPGNRSEAEYEWVRCYNPDETWLRACRARAARDVVKARRSPTCGTVANL